MAVCCQRKYGNGCFRKTTPLHHYLYSDRMAGKLCDVRHSAYSFSRKLVIDEYADSAFVVATQALGLFLFSLFPAISLIISIVSMVGSLGATLSGVTFPVPNMYPLVRDASYLFPVRHFTEMMQNMLYGGVVLFTFGHRL